MKIGIGQIEVISADPRKNLETILKCIVDLKDEKVDLIVFPEMAIPGYLLGDMWERKDFLEECKICEEELKEATKNINSVIAFGNIFFDPNKKNEDGRERKKNTCVVIKNGIELLRANKTLQPNYREFDDDRHFYSTRKEYSNITRLENQILENILVIDDTKIGFMLCEDGWDNDYSFSPMDVMAPNCDLVVNISCSPFTMGKNSKRNRIFSAHAAKNNTPIIYVNNVGIQNNGKTLYVFDGDSCVYDKDGDILKKSSDFIASCMVVDLDLKSAFGTVRKTDDERIAILHDALVYGIQSFMNQIGQKKVVIGASGGIDSAVVAALFSEILPKNNIWLVNMPSKFNSQTTKDLACNLAENIGCNYHVIPISESVEVTTKQLKQEGMDLSSFNLENVQARDRSSRILAAIASHVGGIFTCNANKSEMTVGYTTMYGDLGGAFAPLADVWKTDVYALAKYINYKYNNLIPFGILTVKPSAELSSDQDVDKGKGDPLIYEYHDKLFESWVERWDRKTPADILDWFLKDTLEAELGFDKSRNIVKEYFDGDIAKFISDIERWWNLFDGFAYVKRIQAPPVLAISRRAFGFDLRESQTKPFYSSKFLRLKAKILENN